MKLRTDVNNQIASLREKTFPHNQDYLLIEDSQDFNSKKFIY
jgi:hypothetical protein